MTLPNENSANHGGAFCGRTRREFLWEAGAKFTGLALTGMLVADGFFNSIAIAATGASGNRQSARPEAADDAGQGQERHLSCSCTAGQAMSIRSTTSRNFIELDGQTIADQNVRPRRQEKRRPRRRTEMEVQAIRPVRQVDQRSVSESRDLRRRHRVHPFDDGRLADPRLGDAANEHRQNSLRQPVPRFVGQLRPGERQ